MEDEFDLDGVALARRVLTPKECADLTAHATAAAARGSAGTRRLLQLDWCQSLAARLRDHLPPLRESPLVAVQCTYFEKSQSRNWLVPLHQDLSIPVREQREAPGFGPWSRKEGNVFVQPPEDVLQQLVAVRLHLDPCSEADGPLQVVPGSHDAGILTQEAAVAARQARGLVTCVADPGDALLMRPLLLHASSKATGTSLRRVLHFLFGPRELPHGIQWRHAI